MRCERGERSVNSNTAPAVSVDRVFENTAMVAKEKTQPFQNRRDYDDVVRLHCSARPRWLIACDDNGATACAIASGGRNSKRAIPMLEWWRSRANKRISEPPSQSEIECRVPSARASCAQNPKIQLELL